MVATVLLWGAVLSVSQPVWSQEGFEPPPLPTGAVTEIRIEGTRRVEPIAVENVLGTRVGQPVARDQLRRDILAIRRLSTDGTYFDDVQVDVTAGPTV
jgi:outer membrane protein assembly factor BamA